MTQRASIYDRVAEGHLTPEEGALLLEPRDERRTMTPLDSWLLWATFLLLLAHTVANFFLHRDTRQRLERVEARCGR